MDFDVGVVLLFVVLGCAMVFGALFLGRFLRPPGGRKEAESTYECGEKPLASGWYNFNPRFYLLALVFLIFDVEIAITFPALVVLKDWTSLGLGWLAFIEVVIFVVILVAGLAYLWARGDLQWIKKLDGRPSTNAD